MASSSASMGTHSGSYSDLRASTPGWSGDDVPRVLGRYVLLRRIARGGMGEVFLASTTGIEGAERPVVAKIIRREHSKDPSFIARFLDEARVQAQLQHSGVAQVIDATIDDRTGEPYAIVEHVEGRSLGDVRARAIQIGHAIGWADAVALATLIAEALAHVHERQDPAGRALAIVHRDLSPQNVMVSYLGECKIIDFGTARGQNRRCHTVAGVVFAKPGYVAPEVANGDSGDSRVDLYALGVMLWELCAGRRFLQGDAGAHMAAVARNAKNLPPVAISIGAPAELDAVIAKLTAFDRDARYPAARGAASDLARLLGAAGALPSGERGVRARVAHLMTSLFPGEPGATRREFARLIATAREKRTDLPTPPRTAAPEPSPRETSTPRRAEAAPAPVSVGDVLGGTRYRLIREIGRGMSSVVYEAEHLDLGKRVAIKLIEEGHGRSSDLATRFRREARTLSRLSHEGLVAVHDVGQADGGRLYCVMELLEGETLEARLSRDEVLGYREALAVTRRILEALEVAHGAALVHRDIKPANVFLVRGERATIADVAGPSSIAPSSRSIGVVKLLDFGLARDNGDADTKSPHDATGRTGFTLYGTPEYMAPEQAAAAHVDARADLYALGCVLYEMLTGRLPFKGASSVAILDAKIKGSPERPRERAPAREIPERVDELVMKALARHASERFQTATEMRAALDAVLAEPVRQTRSRLVGASAMAAVAILAIAAAGTKWPVLRAKLPWFHAKTAVVAAAVAPAPPPAAPTPSAEPKPEAEAANDEASAASDNASAAPEAAGATADPAPSAPASSAPASSAPAAEKPRPSKRAKKSKVAVKPDGAPSAEPERQPAHRKHKAKAARVE